jgi:hypothetical protein
MIHACVDKSSDKTRIVGVDGVCTNSETAVHWPGVATVGPTGPTGPAGPAGPPGEPGLIGLSIATPLPDVRLTTSDVADTWFPLAGRVVSMNKSSDVSKLRITHQDTLGTRSNIFNACRWRIMLDATPLAFFSEADLEGTFGWRMHNGAHMAWAFNVPAGMHEVRVEGLRSANATECLSGWNTSGNFLSVEEIP